MKCPKGKYYDPELKLKLVKEFLGTDKTLKEIAEENGIDSKLLSKWTVKYREEGSGVLNS